MASEISERLNVLLTRLRLWNRTSPIHADYRSLEDAFWKALEQSRWIESGLNSLLREDGSQLDGNNRVEIIEDTKVILDKKLRSGRLAMISRKYVRQCVRNVRTQRHRQENRERVLVGREEAGDQSENIVEGAADYREPQPESMLDDRPERDGDWMRRELESWKLGLDKPRRWAVDFFLYFGLHRTVDRVRKSVNECLAIDPGGLPPIGRRDVEAIWVEILHRLDLDAVDHEAVKGVIRESWQIPPQRDPGRSQPKVYYDLSSRLRDLRNDRVDDAEMLDLIAAYDAGQDGEVVAAKYGWPPEKAIVKTKALVLAEHALRLSRLYFDRETLRRFYRRIVDKTNPPNRVIAAFESAKNPPPQTVKTRALAIVKLARERHPFPAMVEKMKATDLDIYEALASLKDAWNESRRPNSEEPE